MDRVAMTLEDIPENLGMRQEYTLHVMPVHHTALLHTHSHQGKNFSIANPPTGKSLERPWERTYTDMQNIMLN